MHTPIALLIFNRPDTTAEVFASIAAAQPRRLFIIADGPRSDRPDDVERCAAARAVTERVSWDCEVTRIYAEANLGCGVGPATGISKVFDQVEQAIILEDDCVPHLSFFRFCAELLARYRDDERVMMISGNNFLLGRRQTPRSYYFNHYAGMWGWSTWRRAWRHHQPALDDWPRVCDGRWLRNTLVEPAMVSYWRQIFERIYRDGGARDIWDAQWYFAMWSRQGLSISPHMNLVSNIGFRADATHTTGRGRLGHLTAEAMRFPLEHPRQVARDLEADLLTMRHAVPSLFGEKPHERIARLLPTPIRAGLLSIYRRLRTRSAGAP